MGHPAKASCLACAAKLPVGMSYCSPQCMVRGPDRPAPGVRLVDRYELHDCIGMGGMGAVYRATDTALGRTVAVKVLPRSLVRSPKVVERFVLEARRLGALDHSNIVPVYDVGRDDDDHLFFVMKLLEGRTLADAPLPMRPMEVLRCADEVLGGLAYIHERGLVHRDLKPENLFLEDSGRVVILDFGILRATAEDDPTATTGFALGTPGYMSPEVIVGEPGDARSDVFGLAVVMYEALTGQLPWAAPAAGKPLVPPMRRAPRLQRFLHAAHPALEALVARGLEVDPAKRFADAAEMREAVAEATARVDEDSSRIDRRVTTDSIVVRRKSRWFAIVGAVAASAALAAGGLFVLPAELRSRVLQAEGSSAEAEPTASAKTGTTSADPTAQGKVVSISVEPASAPTPRADRPLPSRPRHAAARTPSLRIPASGATTDRCTLSLPYETDRAERDERLRELIKASVD